LGLNSLGISESLAPKGPTPSDAIIAKVRAPRSFSSIRSPGSGCEFTGRSALETAADFGKSVEPPHQGRAARALSSLVVNPSGGRPPAVRDTR
jgi:hypothetical protein